MADDFNPTARRLGIVPQDAVRHTHPRSNTTFVKGILLQPGTATVLRRNQRWEPGVGSARAGLFRSLVAPQIPAHWSRLPAGRQGRFDAYSASGRCLGGLWSCRCPFHE